MCVHQVDLSSGDHLPLSDRNAWYYPSNGHDSDEEELGVGSREGNWGHKTAKGARWVRRGKITAWGPEMDDWEVCSLKFTRPVDPYVKLYLLPTIGRTKSTEKNQTTAPSKASVAFSNSATFGSFPISPLGFSVSYTEFDSFELYVFCLGQVCDTHIPFKPTGRTRARH